MEDLLKRSNKLFTHLGEDRVGNLLLSEAIRQGQVPSAAFRPDDGISRGIEPWRRLPSPFGSSLRAALAAQPASSQS